MDTDAFKALIEREILERKIYVSSNDELNEAEKAWEAGFAIGLQYAAGLLDEDLTL